MPNTIKYSTTGDTLSLRKGNFYFGLGDVPKGPTSDTGHWNGITPPSSGYTIYENKSANGPSIRVPANSTALIDFSNRLYSGSSITTTAGALTYLNGLSTVVCVNMDYEPIITSGLTFLVDAGFTPSYYTSGTNWLDISLNNINGTLTNGPTFNSSNGGSLVFDGSNDYVTFGNQNLGLDLISKTFCAWVNLGSTLANPTSVIDKQFDNTPPSSNYGGWGFWIGSDRKLWWWNMPNEDIRDNGSTTIGTNVWNHIAVTYNSTTKTASFYINGSLNSSVSNSNIVEQSSGTQSLGISVARIGQVNQSGYLNGSIANVLAYNRVLSASEVLQNYNAQKSRFQSSFDPDAQAFITAAGITDSTQQTAINQLVLDLKSYNIWSSMVAIYPFVGGTANTNKYNLKNTSTYTLSFGGGWTHSSTGSLPNGTNAYADTGISPNSVLGSSYNYSVYSRTNTNTSGTIIGAMELGGYICGESGIQYALELYLRSADFLLVRDQPSGGYAQFSNTSSSGYYIINRTGTLTAYKNGTLIGTITASQSIPYFSLSLGATFVYDNDCGYGYYDFFDNKEISFATFANASLTSTNISNLNTAVQAFQTTLGRQV